MLESSVYKGLVTHDRVLPKPHSFRYTLTMLLLDLDEAETWLKPSWLTSFQRFNLASFQASDYLGQASSPEEIKANVIAKIAEDQKITFTGKVFLLTQVRRLGFVFNPVSFYLCVSPNGTLCYIISEIENTPWGERYCYIHEMSGKAAKTFDFSKSFHVSPFMPMDLNYVWSFNIDPRQLISISMNCFNPSGEKHFNASLCLKKAGTSPHALDRAAVTNMFATLLVPLRIYWQALKLWIKKVPFYSHPNPQKRKGW